MSRIPFGRAATVATTWQAARILLARQGKLIRSVARFPETVDDLTAFLALFDNVTFRIMRSCFCHDARAGDELRQRCQEEYEQIAFWDFIARRRDRGYRKYLGRDDPFAVAMRAEESSTRTVGRILLQLFYGLIVPGRVFARLLNGPTNDTWIDPWRAHLTGQLGVTLVPNATVHSFNLAGNRIGSVSVERDGRFEEVTADFYVVALPVEVMQGLVTPQLVRAAPSLARPRPYCA
jgi:uncharacterized protein with NAD-binding domain and iron-sulfur cluster